MAQAPPALKTYQGLVSTFSEFLVVAIHLILYERAIYPRETFLKTQKFNFPVQQNRHPKVCKWIAEAVAAVQSEMIKCTVSQTSLIIYSTDSIPLERYVFSTDLFPVVKANEGLVPFEAQEPELEGDSPANSRPSTPTPHGPGPESVRSMLELTTQFAAVLSRISVQAAKLQPLPDGCSFTLAIELRDPPVGRLPLDNGVAWLPSEPGLQPAGKGKSNQAAAPAAAATASKMPSPKESRRGEHLEGGRTTAVRSVEAGPFIMEVWIEEGKGKLQTSSISSVEGD